DGQRVGQAFNLLEGEEPVAGDLWAASEAEGRVVGAHFRQHGEVEHLAQHLARPVCPHRRGLRRGELSLPVSTISQWWVSRSAARWSSWRRRTRLAIRRRRGWS